MEGEETMVTICAWCGHDMGEKNPEQPGITHGICEPCKRAAMRNFYLRRRQQEILESLSTERESGPASLRSPVSVL